MDEKNNINEPEKPRNQLLQVIEKEETKEEKVENNQGKKQEENNKKIREEKETTTNSNNNFEEVTIKGNSKQIKKTIRTDSYFDGKLLDLIGWRILAFLITAITFGIAAPWAQCMLYSYQIKHTVYNGKRLKFEGTGGDLFVNIFKWIFFSIITLGLYTFAIPVKKAKWVISNIHFEDEQLITGESYFDGNTFQLIGVDLLTAFLNIVSFGLLFPFTVCYKIRWILKHTVINRKKLVFTGSAFSLLGHYLLWFLLLVVTFGIYGLWLPIAELKWQTKNIHIRTVGEVEKKDNSIWFALPIAFLGIIIMAFAISNINIQDIKQIADSSVVKEFKLDELIKGSKKNNNGKYIVQTNVKRTY